MPAFIFTARDKTGKPQRGMLVAGTAAELASQLRLRGWLVLDIQPTNTEVPLSFGDTFNPGAWLGIRSVDVELALQQLAVMLRSGLTLLNALQNTSENAERVRLQRVLKRVILRVQEGSSFADALAEHRCFNNLTVQLVRVGEQTGSLETVLVRASEAMERRRTLIQQVVTAMTYPGIVLIAAIGVTAFMLVGVIPKLKVFVNALGRQLPPSTQRLIDLSGWLQLHGATLAIVICLIPFVVYLLASIPTTRYQMDALILRLPLFGKVARVAATALFARALALLLGSGVTVLDALRTMELLGKNQYLNGIIERSRQRVFAGGALAPTLEVPHGYMPMLSRMVAVGESAGTLDSVLDEVAKFYEQQLQVLIRQLSALLEPAIIVFVGGIVGYVYISFFLALYAGAGPARH